MYPKKDGRSFMKLDRKLVAAEKRSIIKLFTDKSGRSAVPVNSVLAPILYG